MNVEGFGYYPAVVDCDEEKKLITDFTRLEWEPVSLFGQIAKRRVMHFGMGYNYDLRTVQPTQAAPDFLKPLIIKCSHYLKIEPDEVKEILISEYPCNAGIGWHCDSPVFEKIIGVSLLSDCIIHFRKRINHKEQFKLPLERGSIYTLSNAIRWKWEHRIAPVKALRYSITFRTLRHWTLDN